MSSEKNQSFVVENGVTLGVIVLALFVIFGVGLPRWIDHSESSSSTVASQEKIELPAKLSGGYAAADVKSSWGALATGKNAKQVQQQVTQLEKSIAKGNKSLEDALPGAAATRAYIKTSSKGITGVVSVQAFRASGGAFAPTDIGIGSSTLQKVGDGVCMTKQQATSTGQAVNDITCQKSGDNLTVQVNAQGLLTTELVKYADELYDEIA
ncbi:hypothetical protein [Nocardioides sp. KR10-350]|uniref:hypothetical protein n=1 Tax=Nocardioides cheoyonin TaxID=3156615 RepID=UPI0032B34025